MTPEGWFLIGGCIVAVAFIGYVVHNAISIGNDDEKDSMRGDNWMAENAEWQQIGRAHV